MTPTHPGAGDGTRNFCMLGMHFITHLPSQSYFSIPNILAFLQKFALQHFYNVIINTSHSFLLQNLFLIREDLVNNFFFKGQLKPDNFACHLGSYILLLGNDTWQCFCSVTGEMHGGFFRVYQHQQRYLLNTASCLRIDGTWEEALTSNLVSIHNCYTGQVNTKLDYGKGGTFRSHRASQICNCISLLGCYRDTETLLSTHS